MSFIPLLAENSFDFLALLVHHAPGLTSESAAALEVDGPLVGEHGHVARVHAGVQESALVELVIVEGLVGFV